MTWEDFFKTALWGIVLVLLFSPGGKYSTILCSVWIIACAAFGITALVTGAVIPEVIPISAESLPHP